MRNLGLFHQEVFERFTGKVPLGRLARIEDVVQRACLLASHRASYLTGQAINLTGRREMKLHCLSLQYLQPRGRRRASRAAAT